MTEVKASKRIPLLLGRKKEIIKVQIQYGVLGAEGKRVGRCADFVTLESGNSEIETGYAILKILEALPDHEDLTPDEFYRMKKMSWEEHIAKKTNESWEFFEVKDDREMVSLYQMCDMSYDTEKQRYNLGFFWFDRRRRFMEYSPSTGKPGLLTFDTSLEFDDTIEPEALGRMVLEAFDRCEQLADMAAGNKYPTKEITLLDESVIEVQMPRDKHFADAEDMGVGEIYQAYEYLPSEDADSSANFYLGIGAELNCDVSAENIRATWEKYYGTAEFFEVEEANCGIYTLRAELRNKKFHRISYFLPQSETLLLECAMELFQPGKRKKLDEKLTELFEDFAERCRMK